MNYFINNIENFIKEIEDNCYYQFGFLVLIKNFEIDYLNEFDNQLNNFFNNCALNISSNCNFSIHKESKNKDSSYYKIKKINNEFKNFLENFKKLKRPLIREQDDVVYDDENVKEIENDLIRELYERDRESNTTEIIENYHESQFYYDNQEKKHLIDISDGYDGYESDI